MPIPLEVDRMSTDDQENALIKKDHSDGGQEDIAAWFRAGISALTLGDRLGALSAMRSGHELKIEALEFIEAIVQLSEQASEVNYFKKLALMAQPWPSLSCLMPEFEAALRGLKKEFPYEILFKAREKFDLQDYQAVLNIILADPDLKNEPAM